MEKHPGGPTLVCPSSRALLWSENPGPVGLSLGSTAQALGDSGQLLTPWDEKMTQWGSWGGGRIGRGRRQGTWAVVLWG